MNSRQSEKAEQFRQDLLRWSDDNLRSFPWRNPKATPYDVLIAEMFLKQTRSATVASILPDFLKRFPSPEALDEADREEIIDVIRPLGIYNHRSKALKQVGEKLSGSSMPDTEEELMKLPQVGRYVANATLCFGFDKPRPIVDSNIRRTYSRLFQDHNLDSLPDGELWEFAQEMLPESNADQYNMALLDFGAEICTDSSPDCEACFASTYCNYYQNK